MLFRAADPIVHILTRNGPATSLAIEQFTDSEPLLKISYPLDNPKVPRIEWGRSLTKADALASVLQFVLNIGEIRRGIDSKIESYGG